MYNQTRLSKRLEIIGPGQNRFTERPSLSALASLVNNYDTIINRNFGVPKLLFEKAKFPMGYG
jgi:hypothetical protein